jgi:hypothetical protein
MVSLIRTITIPVCCHIDVPALKLTAKASWLRNLQDTDLIIESFFRQCHAAGPEKCALYSEDIGDIRRKYFDTVYGLIESPIAVPASENLAPEIINYQDVKLLIIQFVYSPQRSAGQLAFVINELSKGNGTVISALKQELLTLQCPSPLCTGPPDNSTCELSIVS